LAYTDEAIDNGGGNNGCPVALVNSLELDDEFGAGASSITRCLYRRHNVKVLLQINRFCRNAVSSANCTTPYTPGNIRNLIKDYEVTYGMIQDQDYENVAVAHSGGGWLILTNDGTDGTGSTVTGRNQFASTVKGLIADGVKMYFCQNTTRGFIGNDVLSTVAESTAGETDELIEGMALVPGTET
ncbi:MAG TPA: hypothetical protein VET88_06610, partial [Gammaproteobacteria bacterium]|nr:hypothetical protein [Gammaproteobacteria bacterium]